ncbi:uncharacterized protein CTRU02_212131 [Colletotrichum truncatum]|uniref:Uncharacterized protein n=1 Tax=Colletotrichum truncatum TaxID=5467 RepID=A0ACC3YMN6_COLTU|nr:uncharacterized protein CTRU02_06798 [Colletotrichum truncatum]KAF6792181.1 hypothetical protein CTRU02_06798 [Colletotrichum truncatum]
MKRSATLLLTSVGASVAQNSNGTKIDVVAPYLGNSSFHASVKDVSADRTTYILGCEAATAVAGCVDSGKAVGNFSGLTIINAPTTVEVHHTYTDKDVSVSYAGYTTGDSLIYDEYLTREGTPYQLAYFQMAKSDFTVHLTVTAGAEKLAQQTAKATEPAQAGASATVASQASATNGTAKPTSISIPNAATSHAALSNVFAGFAGAAVVAAMLL